jgi:hypothetical protein
VLGDVSAGVSISLSLCKPTYGRRALSGPCSTPRRNRGATNPATNYYLRDT